VERSLVLIKPDAVQRSLIGNIISRLECRGLKIIGLKMVTVSEELAAEHYAIHKGKSFYSGLIKYICSSPVIAIVFEAPNAIKAIRQMMGATNPLDAAPGSIRHDYALTIGRNLTHASDSIETANKEIALWFNQDEISVWQRNSDSWVFETN
jgi:nucleoside-diphosphate kinase